MIPSPPTPAHVESIAAVADPVSRNLRITQCYHELATALADRIPGHANWCAFATWASKQAGQSIRQEDLQAALSHAFDASPALDELAEGVAERLVSLGAALGIDEIRRIVKDALDIQTAAAIVADAVARGNLKVFAEIGLVFARFLAERAADEVVDAAAITRFCETLHEGEPPEGQRYLRQAFSHYYAACFEPRPEPRAELMLLANLEVGLHEQARLQPEILEALNAPVIDPNAVTPRLIAAVLPRGAAFLARARRFVERVLGGPTPLDRAVRALVEAAQREARLVITERLMTLALPRGELLRLGSDIAAAYPPELATIENDELRALIAQVDPTPDSTRDSGARDWGDLPERMHFIADLFRAYHASPDLADPPFDAAQVEAITAGRRPAALRRRRRTWRGSTRRSRWRCLARRGRSGVGGSQQ